MDKFDIMWINKEQNRRLIRYAENGIFDVQFYDIDYYCWHRVIDMVMVIQTYMEAVEDLYNYKKNMEKIKYEKNMNDQNFFTNIPHIHEGAYIENILYEKDNTHRADIVATGRYRVKVRPNINKKFFNEIITVFAIFRDEHNTRIMIKDKDGHGYLCDYNDLSPDLNPYDGVWCVPKTIEELEKDSYLFIDQNEFIEQFGTAPRKLYRLYYGRNQSSDFVVEGIEWFSQNRVKQVKHL
jgi:hypothetical protein